MLKLLFILTFVWIISGNSFSQNPFISNYTVSDGLPTNKAFCVFQDSKGFIWVGTDDGVIKFDGTNFRHYDDKDGIDNGIVIKIKEDLEGRIWLINLQGSVNYIKDGKIYNEHNQPFLGEIKTQFFFHDFFQDVDSTLYFYNYNSEIYVVKNNEYIDYSNLKRNMPEGQQNLFHVSKTNDGEFMLWFSEFFYSFRHIDEEYKKTESSEFFVKILTADHINNFGINSSGKILHYFNDSLLYSFDNAAESQQVNSILVDEEGYYWVSVYDKGLFCYKDGELIKRIDIDKIMNLVLDKENNIWTVSNSSGIHKISRNILDYEYMGIENFEGLGIKGLQKASNNDYWLTNGKTVYYAYKNALYPVRILGLSNRLSNIIQTDDKTLIMSGFNTPLYKFKNFKFNNINKKISFDNYETSGFLAKDLAFDSESRKIYTARNDDVVEVDIDHFTFTVLNTNRGRITNLFINNKGKLVVNSDINYEMEEYKVYNNSDYRELDGKLFTANLTLDKENELIVTLGNDFFLHQNERFINLTKNTKEQFDYRIRGLAYDGSTIYFYTIKSVYFVDDDLIQYKDGNMITRKIDLEFNGINDLMCHDSLLYVASDDGLLYIPTNDVKSSKQTIKPKCYFHKVFIDDEEFDFINNNVDCQSNHRLTIDFASLNYSSSPSEYSYKLQGVDENWIEGRENRVTYLNLPPGKYKFQLKARISNNEYGMVSELPLLVMPTFFQRTVVRISIIILFSLLLLLAFWIAYQRKLNKKITENTLINLEHKALQSMMNPHFIFNALGSIQRYLLEHKPEEAGAYLSRFARLIRQNMNSLRTNSIDVNEEVERLRNYLELERFRMNNSFEYLIEIDERIDDFDIVIPSMVVQPYVENAIWHGISSLDRGSGEIRVFFKPADENSIEIIVEDNGVGMDSALSDSNNSEGLKMGTSIAEKRLQILGNKMNISTKVVVESINPGERYPGTRVIIICPVIM